MTAVALPELDLNRLRHAVDRMDLPNVDLRRLDLDRIDLEGARRDLGRLRSNVEGDLSRLELPHVDLPHVDLPRIDLPDLDRLLGRKRQPSGPDASVVVGALALVGGLLLGAVLAYFLNPTKGAKRRRTLRRRIGVLQRRMLG